MTTRAWIGLGGNIGDVPLALKTALNSLDSDPHIQILAVSLLYRTPPWGKEDQPWFVNACAEIATDFVPEELLESCQAVERAGLRERKEKWGPRTIDVDIIAFEGVEQTEQRLTLPHPHAHERPFVLTPLADIAPTLKLRGQQVQDLMQKHYDPRLEPFSDTQDWWMS